MPLPFLEENTKSWKRLEALAARLTDQDLQPTTPFGWGVGALLAHLAFMDQRVLVLLRRWQTQGFNPSPLEETSINDALKPIALARTALGAMRLVRSRRKCRRSRNVHRFLHTDP